MPYITKFKQLYIHMLNYGNCSVHNLLEVEIDGKRMTEKELDMIAGKMIKVIEVIHTSTNWLKVYPNLFISNI